MIGKFDWSGYQTASNPVNYEGDRLARRPAEVTPTKHMEMQVKNRLPSITPCIGHNAIARFGKTFVCGDLSTGKEQTTEQGLIRLAEVLNRRNMPLWNDQGVNGCLRADIIERQCMLVLIHHFCGNAAIDDTAKNTGTHRALPGYGSVLRPDFPNRFANS